MDALTRADLEAWLAARGGQVVWHRLAVETPTVKAAANALGIGEDRIVKSLVFLAAGEPVLVLANGRRRVDMARLAATLGLPHVELRFAPEEQAKALTGYPTGAMPPFGHRVPLRTLMDRAVADQTSMVTGTGDPHVLLSLSLTELQRLTGAEQAELAG